MLKILSFIGYQMESNCYFLFDNSKETDKTNNAVLIDASCDIEILDKAIKYNKIKHLSVVLTHGHYDHTMNLCEIVKKYNPDIYISFKDGEMLKKNNYTCLSKLISNCEFEGLDDYSHIHYVEKTDKIPVSEKCFLTVFESPGHTEGSLMYSLESDDKKAIFSGDTIMKMSVGRCDFPTGNLNKLKISLQLFKNTYEVDYVIYPGHGEETNLNFEKKNNPYL